MKKISVQCMYNYIIGHFNYSHLEGEVELTDKEFEEFKNDPINFYQNNEVLFEDLEFILDDCEIEIGDIDEISYIEI